MAKTHRILTGRAPMPWQQYFYDVIGEVNPDTGVRVYREALLNLSRQQGKTTNVRTVKVHRALDCQEPQTILFAAQDGIEAKQKWLEHCELVNQSPFRLRVAPDQPVTSNGKENFGWVNGSSERPISSRPTSGHGVTLDLGVVTEAFSQTDYRYEDTMLPAMRARPDAQFIAESAAGTALSTYWNERIEAERERFRQEPDRPSRVALFDWSADLDVDDPELEATWAKVTPALGYTITLEQLRHDFETANTPSKWRAFLRGALNVPDMGAAAGTIINADDLEKCFDGDSRIRGAFTFSLDIANDRSWAAVGVAGESYTGFRHVGLAHYERGTHWIIDWLTRNMRDLAADTVYVATGSQAALMAADLERAGLTVIVLSRAEVGAACAGIYDDIVDHNLRLIPGQTDLEAAVGGAVWTAGDVRVFSRANSAIDISPLYAVTLARFGHTVSPEAYPDILSTIA